MRSDLKALPLSRINRWPAALVVLFLSWYGILGYYWEVQKPEMPYFATEWFVTYSGGFVRRGLMGQILYSLSAFAGANPMFFVDAARTLTQFAFLGLFAFLVYKNRQTVGNLGVVVFLTCPFLGFYAWYMAGSLDVFFILITAAHLWLATNRTGKDYFRTATLLFSTLGVFFALSHEVYLFVCLPINVVISWRHLAERKVEKLAAIYGLSLVAVLTVSLIKVHLPQTDAITRAWASRGITLPSPSAVDLLSNNLRTQVGQALQDFSAVTAGFWALSVLLSGLPVFLWWRQEIGASSSDKVKKLKSMRLDYFLIPLACTLPLYVLGNDWHRWISLPMAIGLVCLLIEGLRFERSSHRLKFAPALAVAIVLTLFTHPLALYADRKSIGVGALTCSVKVLGQHLKRFHRSNSVPDSRVPIHEESAGLTPDRTRLTARR